MIELTTAQAKTILEEFAAYLWLSGCIDKKENRLVDIRTYGIIIGCYQWRSEASVSAMLDEFNAEAAIVTATDERILALLEIHGPVTLSEAQSYRECIQAKYPDLLIKYDYCLSGDDNVHKLTVIVYKEGKKRPIHSRIQLDYDLMLENEKREKKHLEREFKRIWKTEGHHLLWRGAASSYSSASEVVDKLRPEILRQKSRYDVTGMILFIDMDRDFTTLSEIDIIREKFSALIGPTSDIGMTVVKVPSQVKFIACRLFLTGNLKFVQGSTDQYSSRYEILLFANDDTEKGYMIVASYADNALTVSRHNWGDYDKNRLGKTIRHLYFDEENTARLCTELNVKGPQSLLRTLKSRFANGSLAAEADKHIQEFCDISSINYDEREYD